MERLKAEPDLGGQALAAELGVSPMLVSHARKKLGLPALKPGRKTSTFDAVGEANSLPTWSHGWLKTDQASIFFRNDEGEMSYEDVRDDLIDAMKRHAPKYPKLDRQKLKDGHLLVVDPADVHIGKLAPGYDVETAVARCEAGVEGLLAKASGFPVEKILLVVGNDALHTEGATGSTTGGTRQDTSGLWHDAFTAARQMYVRVIERLASVAPVHVVYCPSNHDLASGFMLADCLACWFHRSKDVTFDATAAHRKYHLYGRNLLAFDHGDGAKFGDAKHLMADEAPELWAKSRFRYSYKHHLHHKKRYVTPAGQDHIGFTVEYLRSPSPADAWHDRNGYLAPKAVEGFVHHPQNGQVARLTHYFD
jgi:hypothetical protein